MNYTLAITSCDRHDLLTRTLSSLWFDDWRPARILVSEDGPASRPLWLHHDIEYMNVPKRTGLVANADRLMSAIETPYVLWCEDDWLFAEHVAEWLPRSLEILEQFHEIFTVSLRGKAWNHPLVADPRYPFLIAQPNWNGGWGGFAFNPGLRRLKDYHDIGSYAEHVQGSPTTTVAERKLSQLYLGMGYRIADLGRPIVSHTGAGRSRASEKVA